MRDYSLYEVAFSHLPTILRWIRFGKSSKNLLASLPGTPKLQNVLPQDVIRFLAWKDNSGKTQLHTVSCSYLGQKGIYDCLCPIRLVAGNVHTLIQQMMTIFEESGRGRT